MSDFFGMTSGFDCAQAEEDYLQPSLQRKNKRVKRTSSKVRAVYAELRQTLGDRLSPKLAVELASDLVELFREDRREVKADFRTGFVDFYERDIDLVMADGGWDVLSRTEPDIWQQEETERYEIQSAWLRSGVSDQFMEMKI